MKSFLYLLAYILAAILMLSSCGSRKKALKVDTSSSKVFRSEHKDLSANVRLERYADRSEYTPIDPDREMTLPDGRKAHNVKIVDETINEVGDVEVIDRGKVNEEEDQSKKVKDLNVETKKPNPWLWIGLVVATIGGAWVYFNRLPKI